MDELKELTRRLNESEATILRMNQELDTLFKEVQTGYVFVKLKSHLGYRAYRPCCLS